MAAQEEEGLILKFSSEKAKMAGRKIVLPKVLEAIDDEADQDDPQGGRIKKDLEEVKIHDLQYDFTQTVFFKEDEFDDLTGYLELPGGIQGVITLEKTLVTDPSPEIVAKASVQLINKLIFDAIQEAQLDKRKRNNMELYEYVKDLDKELDEYATLAFKIRDRDLKSSILQDIQECKNKTLNFMEVLRSTQGKIPNAQIAKLNDLAYKGVKRGMQKKLDERSLKNEKYYKNLTKQVKEVSKTLDIADL